MQKKSVKKNIFSILFMLPVLLVYSCFLIIPMLSSFYYSLNKWNGITEKSFIGIKNFQTLFHSPDYWITFKNTMILVAVSVLIQIGLGLLIAYLLYQQTRAMKLYRTIFFLPVVIAPVAIGLMFSLFYNSEIGILNKILEAVGLGAWKKNWLSDPGVMLGAVIAPQVWQYIGMYTTIFLAALQSVPDELVESAKIDGADSRQRFQYVIIPQIRGFIEIGLILCVTGSLKSFEHSWVMTNGGPGVRTAYLSVYMYKTAFENSNFGVGSAISVTIVLVALFFTVILKILSQKNGNE